MLNEAASRRRFCLARASMSFGVHDGRQLLRPRLTRLSSTLHPGPDLAQCHVPKLSALPPPHVPRPLASPLLGMPRLLVPRPWWSPPARRGVERAAGLGLFMAAIFIFAADPSAGYPYLDGPCRPGPSRTALHRGLGRCTRQPPLPLFSTTCRAARTREGRGVIDRAKGTLN